MKDRIELLKALSDQQINMLRTIQAVEQKVKSLEDDISRVNNAYTLHLTCETNDGNSKNLLRLRWSDRTAEEADALRQVVRTILKTRLQESQARLQRIVEQEESRLAAILKANVDTAPNESGSN